MNPGNAAGASRGGRDRGLGPGRVVFNPRWECWAGAKSDRAVNSFDVYKLCKLHDSAPVMRRDSSDRQLGRCALLSEKWAMMKK